jgi:hypothetical protein
MSVYGKALDNKFIKKIRLDLKEESDYVNFEVESRVYTVNLGP